MTATNMMKKKDFKKVSQNDIINQELKDEPLNVLILMAYHCNHAALELFHYNT